jgi:signal transduction histidine kinase
MFQRLHNAESYPGTGMGLALCKKIAEMHQGFMTVESKLREGSRFIIFLQIGS